MLIRPCESFVRVKYIVYRIRLYLKGSRDLALALPLVNYEFPNNINVYIHSSSKSKLTNVNVIPRDLVYNYRPIYSIGN